MVKILAKCMRICMITLLTIVYNQQGELVPDQTYVINNILDALSELQDMEAK